MSILGIFEDTRRWSAALSEFLETETPSSAAGSAPSPLTLLNLRKKVDVIVSHKEVRWTPPFILKLRRLLKDLQRLINLRYRVHIFLGEDLEANNNPNAYCTSVFLYCYRHLRKYLRECAERFVEWMQQQKNIFPGEFKPEDTFKIRDYLLDFDDDGDDSALTTSFDSKPSYDKRTFEEIDDHQNKLKLSLVYMFMDLEDICAEVRRSWEQLRNREIHVLEPIVISIAAMHLVRKLQAEFKLMFPEIECFLKDIFGDVIPGGDIFSAREAKAFMNIQIVREFASICAAIEQFRKVFTLDKKPTRHKPFYEDSGDPLTFEPARLVKFYETDLCLLLDRVEDSMGDSIPQDALKQSALCTSMLLYPINDAFLYDWYYLQAVFFIWVWVTSVQVMSDPVYLLKSKLVYVYRRWRRKINQNYYQSRLAAIMPAIDAVYTTPMSHFVFHELYQTEDNHFFCGWNDVLYNNPLIAGSLLLDTVLLQRDMIQQGGDCFFSLFRAVSFLYVALRQEGYLHVPIPLVELIISAYKEHGLFHPMQHPSSSEVPGPNGADTTSHRENTYNIPSIEEYFGRYLSAERVSLTTISAIQTALRSATHKDQIETAKKKLKIALEVSRRKFQASIQQQNKQMIATYFASASTLEVQYSRVYGDYDSGAHYYSTERKECISLPHSPYRSRTLEVVYERCLPMEKPVRTSVEEELGLPVAGGAGAGAGAGAGTGAGPATTLEGGGRGGEHREHFTDEVTIVPGFPSVMSDGPMPAHHRQDCSRILESTARMFQREMSVTKHLSLDVNLVLSKLIVFFSVLMQRMPIVAEGMAGVPMPTTPCTVPSSSGAAPSSSTAAGSSADASANNAAGGGASDLKGRYLYALGDAVVTWALPLLDVSPSERTSYQDELLRTLSTYFVDILGRGELADVDYVDNKFCLFPDVRGATKNIFAEEFGFPLPAGCPAAYQPPPSAASSAAASTATENAPPTAADAAGAAAVAAVPTEAAVTAPPAAPSAAPSTLPAGVQQTYHDVLALLARMKHSATPTAVMSAFHTASNNIAGAFQQSAAKNNAANGNANGTGNGSGNANGSASSSTSSSSSSSGPNPPPQNLVWHMPNQLSQLLANAAIAVEENVHHFQEEDTTVNVPVVAGAVPLNVFNCFGDDVDAMTRSLLPIWGRSREYHRDLERVKQRIRHHPAVLHLRAPVALPATASSSSSSAIALAAATSSSSSSTLSPPSIASAAYPTVLHHAVQTRDLDLIEWLMAMQTYTPAIHPSVLLPPPPSSDPATASASSTAVTRLASASSSASSSSDAVLQQVLAAYTPVQVAAQCRWKEGLYAMLSFSAHRDVDVPTGPQGNTLLHEAFATGCDAIVDALYFYDFAKTLLLTPNDHGATPRDCYPASRFALWKSLMETPEMKRQVLAATANAASMPTSTSVTTSHALRVPRWILEHEDFITLDMFHQAIVKSTAAHGASSSHTSGGGGGGILSHHATSSSSSAAAGGLSSLPAVGATGSSATSTASGVAAASAFNGMFAGGLIDAAALGLGGLPGGTTASAAMFGVGGGGGTGGGGGGGAAAAAAAAAINLQDANYMASLWQQLLTMKEDPHFAEKVSYHFQQVMTQISRDHRQAPGSTISLNEYCSNMVQWIYDHPEAWQTMKTGGSGGETPQPVTAATSTSATAAMGGGGGGGGHTAATSSKTTNKTASKATASK